MKIETILRNKIIRTQLNRKREVPIVAVKNEAVLELRRRKSDVHLI